MFEQPIPKPGGQPVVPDVAPVLAPEGDPIEFIYRGHHFHIHAVLSRWKESGGWWNRIEDGQNHLAAAANFDDGARDIWTVEAAPVGALATFQIELDQLTKKWLIRPTSRPQ